MTDREKLDLVYTTLKECLDSASITVWQDSKLPQKLYIGVDCTFDCELLIMNVQPMLDGVEYGNKQTDTE